MHGIKAELLVNFSERRSQILLRLLVIIVTNGNSKDFSYLIKNRIISDITKNNTCGSAILGEMNEN
jgi:hypothetical protein